MKSMIYSLRAAAQSRRLPAIDNTQQGFALFVMMVVVFLAGVITVSNFRMTNLTEVLAGNSIQRSRALQSAEGALIESEAEMTNNQNVRTFSTASGETGILSSGAMDNQWWRDAEFSGSITPTTITYPGVITPPKYVAEEIGHYIADGGTGIVSLDRGNAGYGRSTVSGREIVLYKLQSVGSGSADETTAVVESLLAVSQ